MNNRLPKEARKKESHGVGIETFIERLKKVRALNCNPYDIGIDSFVYRQLSWDKPNTSTKII